MATALVWILMIVFALLAIAFAALYLEIWQNKNRDIFNLERKVDDLTLRYGDVVTRQSMTEAHLNQFQHVLGERGLPVYLRHDGPPEKTR